MVAPNMNPLALVRALPLDVEAELGAGDTDGAVVVDLPLLVRTAVRRELHHVRAALQGALDVQHFAGVTAEDHSVLEAELLIRGAGLCPHVQTGPIGGGVAHDIQNQAVEVRDQEIMLGAGIVSRRRRLSS